MLEAPRVPPCGALPFVEEHEAAFRQIRRKASLIASHFATPFREGPRPEAEALARAGEIHRRLRQGEPFGDLPRSMSDHPKSGNDGRIAGGVNSLTRTYSPALAALVFDPPSNTWSASQPEEVTR